MNNVVIYIIPLLVFVALVVATYKNTKPYDSFVTGVKEGLFLSKEVFPSLLAMMTAVTVLRASGLFEDIGYLINTYIFTSEITDVIPMILFRPLSGTASLSILTNICETRGADSFSCDVASVIQGSTDTTFYVITLYFTSVGITKIRHTIKAGLISDFVGIILAITLSYIFLS